MAKSEDVAIRVYVDARISDLREFHNHTMQDVQDEIDRRFAGIERERAAYMETLNERLNRMNYLREAMRDQQSAFVTSELFNATVGALNEKLSDAISAYDRQRGRFAVYSGIGVFVLVAVALMELVLNHVRF